MTHEVTDEDLAKLVLVDRTDRLDGETDRALAQRTFDINAPNIAQSLVEMAMGGKSETVRFKAAVYCMDRVLGSTSSVNNGPSIDDDLMKLVQQFKGVEG